MNVMCVLVTAAPSSSSSLVFGHVIHVTAAIHVARDSHNGFTLLLACIFTSLSSSSSFTSAVRDFEAVESTTHRLLVRGGRGFDGPWSVGAGPADPAAAGPII